MGIFWRGGCCAGRLHHCTPRPLSSPPKLTHKHINPQQNDIAKITKQCHYEKVVVAETASLARSVTYNRCLGNIITTSVAVDGLKCSLNGPGRVPAAQLFHSRGAPRLAGDSEAALGALERHLDSERQKMRSLQARQADLQQELAAAKGRRDQEHFRCRERKARVNRLAARVHEIMTQTQLAMDEAQQAAPAAGGGAGEDDGIQARIAELQGEVAAAQAELDERERELSRAREREAGLARRHDESKAQIEAAHGETDAARGELQSTQEQLEAEAEALEAARKALER